MSLPGPNTFVPFPGAKLPSSPTHRTRHSACFHHLDSILPDDYDVVDEIDLDSMTPGSMSYVWLELCGTCTGTPFTIPVMIAKGALPGGPVLGITCAVHGDEVNGTPVVHAIFQDVSERLDKLRGSIIGIPIANVPSFTQHKRVFPDQAREVDLNRMFPGKKDQTTAHQYVYNLFHKLVPKMDYLIDLHSACFGNLNSMYIRADLSDEVTRMMSYSINADIILHSKGPSGGPGGKDEGTTLRNAATLAGVKTICVELKNSSEFDPMVIQRAHYGILVMMVNLSMITGDPRSMHTHPDAIKLYQRPPVVCKSSYWIFTQTGGLLSVLCKVGSHVRKGEAIAVVTDLFGVVRSKSICPEDGIVIGQSQDPAQNQGGRIVHLGIVTPEEQFPRVTTALSEYEEMRTNLGSRHPFYK